MQWIHVSVPLCVDLVEDCRSLQPLVLLAAFVLERTDYS